MTVAYELGKNLDEIAHLTPGEIADWLAYFKYRDKLEEDAIRKARKKGY